MFRISKIAMFLLQVLPLAAFNIIVVFNINPFYVGTIYSFSFLLFYPGILLSRLLDLSKNLPMRETVIYSTGLSIAYLMFSGLFINWMLPLFDISNPLSLMPLLFSQDVLLLSLLFIVMSRDKHAEYQVPLRMETFRNLYLYIFPLLLPALSVFGALSLNNGRGNHFTMSMWALSAATIICVTLCREKVSYIYYAYLLFVFSTSFLLAMSLRGWTITGHDILPEFFVFQLTKSKSLWDIANYRDAYNACLSITILPTLLSRFLLISDTYIFKVVMQIVFSISLPALFLFIRKYTKDTYAFIACIFFMVQSPFLRDFPYMIRQELAILFYVLALSALFNSNLPTLVRSILFLCFGFSMIVSHYSTAYIGIALFIGMYILSLVFRSIKRTREVLTSRPPEESDSETKYLQRGGRIVILVVFTFLWYSQLTDTGNDFFTFVVKNTQNMSTIWMRDVRNQVLLDQFNIFMGPIDTKELLDEYIQGVYAEQGELSFVNTFPQETHSMYTPYRELDVFLPYNINKSVAQLILAFGELVKKGMKIFIIAGILTLWYSSARQKAIQKEFIYLSSSNLLLLLAAVLILFIASEYDSMRVYQQNLVILSLPAVLGCLQFLKVLRDQIRPIALSTVFVVYFLFVTAFVPQMTGGGHAYLQTNNSGSYYDLYYSHATEIESIRWLKSNRLPDYPVYSDWYIKRKIYYADLSIPDWVYGTVIPGAIDRTSYVYAGYTNIKRDSAYTFFKGYELVYNFPLGFLDANKDLIYNNGDSRIYK